MTPEPCTVCPLPTTRVWLGNPLKSITASFEELSPTTILLHFETAFNGPSASVPCRMIAEPES